VGEVEKTKPPNQQPQEEGEPAEPRHRQLVHAPAARSVDHAEPARHPADRRRQEHDDHEGDEHPPENAEVIAELVEDAEVRAVRRKHDASVLRRRAALACAPGGLPVH
jgi:hypothetical protein